MKNQRRIKTQQVLFDIIEESLVTTGVGPDWTMRASAKATLAVQNFLYNNYRRRQK